MDNTISAPQEVRSIVAKPRLGLRSSSRYSAMSNHKRRHRRRQRLVVHARKSLRKRLKRREVARTRLVTGHQPFVPIAKPSKRRFEILFPKVLDVLNHSDLMIKFMNDVRHYALERRADTIVVDHSPLEMITPEAVTVLMAEFHRITCLSPKLKLQTRQSTIRQDIRDVLGPTGYLKHFNIAWEPTSTPDKIILQHETAARAISERAGKLIEHFAKDPFFPREATKSIGVAIGECMENSVLHAYPFKMGGPILRRQWWLLGMRCPKSHEFFFVFYDQGIGIPKTIRTRWRDRVSMPFLSRSNLELVRLAIEEGAFSSTQDPNRGKGLRTLKACVDKASSGDLVVMTGKVHLRYQHGVGFSSRQLSQNLGGTLIFWRIQS